MSILAQLKKGIITRNPEETIELAQKITTELKQDSIIALSGDLGAGKTTFTKGIAQSLKIDTPVKSPTYNIYSIYEGVSQLVHIDAYRLTNNDSIESLDLDEFLKSPYLIVVEWPEKIHEWIATFPHIWFDLTIMEDGEHRVSLRET